MLGEFTSLVTALVMLPALALAIRPAVPLEAPVAAERPTREEKRHAG
jgi:hypothetical protein